MSKIKSDPGYRDGWCIHYRSPSHGLGKPDLETCEAGVRFDKFKNFRDEGFSERPCFLDKGKSRPNSAPCECLQLPTPEEIALHEEWHKTRMDIFRTVMTGIADWRKANKGKSHREVIECPACKWKLHLSIAAYNSHVHGHCETEGCVSWME